MTALPHVLLAQTSRAIVRKVFGLGAVLKARKKGSPLTPGGFDARVLDMVVEISEQLDPIERAAAKDMVEALQKNWTRLTPKQREAAIEAAAKRYLKKWEEASPDLEPTFSAHGAELAEATRAAAVRTYALGIEASLSIVELQSAQLLAKQQSFYVTNAAGQRSVELSKIARDIASQGMIDGLDDYEIGEQMLAAIPEKALQRSHAYYRMVSSTYVGRQRTSSLMSSFSESGARGFEVVGVLDTLTCEPCRFMDGRVFGVQRALQNIRAAEEDEDPEAVKDRLPWLNVAKDPDDPDGGKAIFIKVGGEKRRIASIVSPSSGKNDARGQYKASMTNAQMASLGVGAPPFHGTCRCSLNPVYGR